MFQRLKQFYKKGASELIRLRDGIYKTDLLITAVCKLDFFTFLYSKPASKEEICTSLGIKNHPADVMLTLFSAMKLIKLKNGKYYLTKPAAKYLTRNSFYSIVPYFSSLEGRSTCNDLYNVLKTGKPSNWSWRNKDIETQWEKSMEDEEFAETFTSAMDSRGKLLAPALVDMIPCKGYKSLLDIAGGSGIYSTEIASKYDFLNISVLEKYPVNKATLLSISKKGFKDKINVITADMFEEIPTGFDIHLYSNALHDWAENNVRTLLAKSFNSLPPNGMILIHDAHLNKRKNGPLPIAEYSVLLIHSTEGRCYSIKEISDWLKEIGFVKIRFKKTISYRSIIIAKKPTI